MTSVLDPATSSTSPHSPTHPISLFCTAPLIALIYICTVFYSTVCTEFLRHLHNFVLYFRLTCLHYSLITEIFAQAMCPHSLVGGVGCHGGRWGWGVGSFTLHRICQAPRTVGRPTMASPWAHGHGVGLRGGVWGGLLGVGASPFVGLGIQGGHSMTPGHGRLHRVAMNPP